jgi:hypothetical protein
MQMTERLYIKLMKKIFIIPIYILGLFGCDKFESDGFLIASINNHKNHYLSNDTVWLEGSKSINRKGNQVHYNWSFLKKPIESSAAFINKEKKITYFIPDSSGEYKFQLEVRNNEDSKIINDSIKAYNFKNVNMLIMYGQSLSIGGGASDDHTDKRSTLSFIGGNNEGLIDLNIGDREMVENFYGQDLVLLNTLSDIHYGPGVSASIAWMQLLEQENKIDLSNLNYQFLLSHPGLSGSSILGLNKGTASYNRLLFSVQKGYDYTIKKGETFAVPILFWVQGESDIKKSKEDYYSLLKQLFIDLNNDIKAITGQTENIKFITYQTSPLVGNIPYPSPTEPRVFKDSGPSWAQLQLALEVNNVYGSMAMYQYEYKDIWHPVDRAIVGLQLGIAAKRLIFDNNPLPVFYPTSHYFKKDGQTV